MLDDQPKIIYSSHGKEGIPDELSHLDYDESEVGTINVPIKKETFKFTISKSKVNKLKNEYKKKMKRYKTYEYRWPKNRDPRLHGMPFLVDSDHMIEKY